MRMAHGQIDLTHVRLIAQPAVRTRHVSCSRHRSTTSTHLPLPTPAASAPTSALAKA